MAGAVLEIAHENLKSCTTMIRDQRDDGLLLGFDGDMEMFDSLFTAIKPYSQIYELDDILDYWVNQVLRLKHQEVKSNLLVKLQSSFLLSLHPKRTNLHLIETVPERNEVNEWRETTSLSDGPQVYGRKHDTNIIVNFLVGYPIVGQGGLGKTTLAQLIFNHGMVVNHFESRIWAYVSENFDLMRVTKDIIEAASGCVCENLDIGLLQRKLQDLLQRKGYLLVLDDWLKPILACGGKGASILVTTRSSKVAIVMGTMPPHELSMLSHNACWELFKHQAFVSNEVQEVGLERIGKEIVKKCGGVPLAAKVLGGLLHFNKDKTKWQYISESTLWCLPKD
ncbi:Disease resistance protein RGA2 [Glycine max]|nr:Disease resistance protein RGA2 [Glycine max]